MITCLSRFTDEIELSPDPEGGRLQGTSYIQIIDEFEVYAICSPTTYLSRFTDERFNRNPGEFGEAEPPKGTERS